MIARCSGCQVEPARGLPTLGEIYALQTGGDRTRHYWLCEECAKRHTLRVGSTGEVLVVNRLATEAQAINPRADLRLVFRLADSPNGAGGSRIYACRSMD